uniref:Protein kinase domain-containing protein n=1 Tax=Panagrolaimus sp. PS1159 TaxID=55785 RepID=A0AC35G213_9BILA
MGERSRAIKIIGQKDTYEYYKENTLGKGGFAYVFKGRRISDKKDVAIKKIFKRLDYGKGEVEHMEQLSKDSKNIYTVKLLDYSYDNDEELYLILPYYKHGSLRDYIKKNGKLDTQTAGSILRQLVSCLTYLHKDKGIMHRDLTSANVIIQEITDDGKIIV